MVVLLESYIPKSYQAEEDCNLETQSQKRDKQMTLHKQICGMFFSKIMKDPEQFITSNDEEQMNKVQEERVFP